MAMQIETLFDTNRLQDAPIVVFILFLLYFPIGVVLLVFRILISFQYLVILAILPKGFLVRQILLRMYLLLVGIPVTTDGKMHIQGSPNIVVSNYISYLDSVVIEAVLPTQRLGKHIDLPGFLKWLFGFTESDDTSCLGLETLDYEYPISCFPEEVTSNGRLGLLRFGHSLFKKSGFSVQPVAISCYRPGIFPANVHCLSSTFWSDMLWTLFFPFTKFHITYLPVRVIPEQEDVDSFVKKVESDIAGVLCVSVTNFTAKDKSDYIKRIAYEKLMRGRALPNIRINPTQINNKYIQMANQVKAVLPQVPFNRIEVEVKRTKNVDITISHFLDGTFKYKPLSEEEQEKEKEIMDKKKHATLKTSSVSVTSTPFGQQPSFQERKEVMIAEARAKYLKLHPEFA